MQQTIIHATGSYPLTISSDAILQKSLFAALAENKDVCIITDTNVAAHLLPTLRATLTQIEKSAHEIILTPGEQHKNLSTFQNIIQSLIENNFHRDTLLIALGGGVIGDITGFVAACYCRGVDWVQIPTTLLAQVDASIGGKTAINHPLGKNLIGAFYPPQAVLIDPNTLNSLPDTIYRQGLAEIIKIALISDASFFEWLEINMDAILSIQEKTLITCLMHSTQLKAQIVEQDERETGIRALLNLGHTFAHAIETTTNHAWQHGEAVAFGLIAAGHLSMQHHGLPTLEFERLTRLIFRTKLIRKLPASISYSQIIDAMKHDKKMLNGEQRLILLKKIGCAFICKNTDKKAIATAIQMTNKDRYTT